jgi:hypothetical protein
MTGKEKFPFVKVHDGRGFSGKNAPNASPVLDFGVVVLGERR